MSHTALEKIRSAVYFLVLVAAIIIVWAAVTSATKSTQIRDTQQDNGELLESTNEAVNNSAETLRLLTDCLQPGGVCNKRQAQQTADILAAFNRSVAQSAIYAAACADRPHPQTAKQIEACVFRKLAKGEE